MKLFRKSKARPDVEKWLSKATDNQRILVDEFIGVLDKTGDSLSVHLTMRACVRFSGIEYIDRVLETIRHDLRTGRVLDDEVERLG